MTPQGPFPPQTTPTPHRPTPTRDLPEHPVTPNAERDATETRTTLREKHEEKHKAALSRERCFLPPTPGDSSPQITAQIPSAAGLEPPQAWDMPWLMPAVRNADPAELIGQALREIPRGIPSSKEHPFQIRNFFPFQAQRGTRGGAEHLGSAGVWGCREGWSGGRCAALLLRLCCAPPQAAQTRKSAEKKGREEFLEGAEERREGRKAGQASNRTRAGFSLLNRCPLSASPCCFGRAFIQQTARSHFSSHIPKS